MTMQASRLAMAWYCAEPAVVRAFALRRLALLLLREQVIQQLSGSAR